MDKKYVNIVLVALMLFLTIYIAGLITNMSSGYLEITIFDVGQGDSILITTPNNNRILIDGGPNNSIIKLLSDEFKILPCKIDFLVISHPHSDHISGLNSVIERCNVKQIGMNNTEYESAEYESLKNLIIDKGIEVTSIVAGMRILSDDIEIDVLWPERSYLELQKNMTNVNNASAVLLLDYLDFEFLLLADIEAEMQGKIHIDEDIEVLKAAHHGSPDGLNEGLVDEIRPEFVIIPVGRNSYGHPSSEVLGSYSQRGIEVLRTDEDGSIKIITDGKRWWFGPSAKDRF